MKLQKLDVTYGSDNVSIPYYRIKGKRKGPSVFISAGIHGNEINGVSLVKTFIDWVESSINEDNLKGELLILPLLNPPAFKAKQRDNPLDGRDLNRSFDVEAPTSISEQMAHDLVNKLLKGFNMGIDIHDSGNYSVFVPHARIHMSDEEKCISCSRNIARIFGTKFILERKGTLSMMAVSMNNKFNIPVLTVEIGGGQKLYPQLNEIGMKGIRNVLAAYGMIEGYKLDLPHKQYIVSYRYMVKTLQSGFISLSVALEQSVEKGDEIGEMYYPETQKSVKIVAPLSGNVFSLWPDNQVKAGVNICSIIPDIEASPGSFIEMENFVTEQITQ